MKMINKEQQTENRSCKFNFIQLIVETNNSILMFKGNPKWIKVTDIQIKSSKFLLNKLNPSINIIIPRIQSIGYSISYSLK